MSPPRLSVWELVKEEIDGGNLAVPDDYEIGSGDHSTSPRHLGNLELPPAPGLLLRSMGSVNVQGRLAPSPFCGIVPKQEQF
jgi:hypothetical protein